MRWEWTDRNPARPPTPSRQTILATSLEAVAKVIAGTRARSAAQGLYLWLVMVTGVRRGELCGPQIRDVEADLVAVDRAIEQEHQAAFTADKPWPAERKPSLNPRLSRNRPLVHLEQLNQVTGVSFQSQVRRLLPIMNRMAKRHGSTRYSPKSARPPSVSLRKTPGVKPGPSTPSASSGKLRPSPNSPCRLESPGEAEMGL